MKKILIIDDDKDFNSSLKEYLGYREFDVSSALDGKQGLSLISTETPDLIITDIVMPELDGIELLDKIQSDTVLSPIKIIAISGGGRIAGQQYLSIAEGLGADCIFEKPLNLDELIEAINNLLD